MQVGQRPITTRRPLYLEIWIGLQEQPSYFVARNADPGFFTFKKLFAISVRFGQDVQEASPRQKTWIHSPRDVLPEPTLQS